MHRVAFETLGCRLNQAETAILQGRFVARGYALVDDPMDADLFVLHTCTLTRHAAAKCRRRLRHVIKRNPGACIAAIGCHAQTDAVELAAIPGVDYVVGTADKLRLDEIIPTPARQARAVVLDGAAPRTPFTVTGAGYDPLHTRANLKIQEGCDFACAFCIIPRSRGRARSRDFDDLVREARELAHGGHRELILTGVNIGTYQEGGRSLVDVIRALEDIEGIDRIRISSIEPTTIATPVLELMAAGGKLCSYLHVPAQSGDDGVLRAMRRHYDAEGYLRFMRDAMDRVPGIGLGTDVIVGFPGEDEAAFERSGELVMSLPFVNVHVFSFSPRPRTSAWAMAGAVAPREIARRSERLHRIARARQHETYAARAGSDLRVLFEQSPGGGVHAGFSDEYIRVETTSPADLRNRLARVRTGTVHDASHAGPLCLRGVIVDDGARGAHSNVHHGEIGIEV